MILACVSDVHVANHRAFGGELDAGINRRCRLVLNTLAEAIETAHARGAQRFAILGDLFDTARPTPQVITAVQGIFRRLDMPCDVLAGNHDLVSDAPGDHALGPLDTEDGPMVVNDGGLWVSDGILYVPWRAGPPLPRLVTILSNMDSRPAVLAMHCGIEDADTPPWLRGHGVPVDDLFELMDQHGIHTAVAGDWHRHRMWRRAGPKTIVQVGTLCPAGWDDPGVEGYGSLILVDTDTGTVERAEIPGPRFIQLGPGEVLAAPVPGCTYYVRRVVSAAELTAARAEMADAVATGMIAGGEVLVDDREARLTARTAATAARAGATLDESVAGYVGSMGLPDGVDRSVVEARVRRYLEA